MVSISEELEAAKAAKAAISLLITKPTPISTVAKTLRSANTAAVLNLGSGGALNEARVDCAIALSGLLDRPPTPERIDKAKSAVNIEKSDIGASIQVGHMNVLR
jgi:hypothetical protein